MKTRNYIPEIKEGAVRMLIEAACDYPSNWSAIKAIALRLAAHLKPYDRGIKSTSIKSFLHRYKRKVTKSVSKMLERENKQLKQTNEIIRKATAFFAQAELNHLLNHDSIHRR